jgi:hypothetical protein
VTTSWPATLAAPPAEEAEDLATVHLELDAPHGFHLVVALDEAVDRDGGGGCRCWGGHGGWD